MLNVEKIGRDKKKANEAKAVLEFFANQGVEVWLDDLELYPEEPADIIHLPTHSQFQVTMAHGEEMGRTLKGQSIIGHLPTDLEGIFREYIIVPIQRKVAQYGGVDNTSLRNVTLLIWDMLDPFFHENLRNQATAILESYQDFFRKAGFKEIYLVFWFPNQKGNIQLFPQPFP